MSEVKKHPAMLALEHLTPGGSEFVDDIPRCVAAVKDFQRIQHNAVLMWAKRAHEAEDEVARLRQVLADVGNAAGAPVAAYYSEGMQLEAERKKLEEVADIVVKAATTRRV